MNSPTPEPPSYPSPRARRRLMAAALLISLGLHALAYLVSREAIPPWSPPAEIVLMTELVPARTARKPAPPPRPAPKRPPAPAKPAEPAADIAPAPGLAAIAPLPSLAPVARAARAESALAAADAFAPLPTLPPAMPELPARVAIAYRLTSSVVDGSANLSWKREGSRYEASTSIRADSFFADFLVGTIRQVSEGEIVRGGLRPELFSLTRGGGEPETAEFLRERAELRSKSRGDTKVEPLAAGLQDTQSFLFQMAIDANRFDAPDARLDVMVTNARKIYRYRFRRVADETLALPSGALRAWHLVSDAADPDDVYEVWLAPELYFLPVKLKFHLGRYPVEQTAISITGAEP